MLTEAHVAFRRLTGDEVAMDGVTPEQVGPLLASNQIILYELTHEGADLESVFLSDRRPRVRRAGDARMINAVPVELIKMRSMPGVWVTFGLAFPLTVLICVAVLAGAGGFPGHTFYFVQTLRQRRALLGAGYFGIEVLAPIVGVLCVTGEYRHKTITTTLVLTPLRTPARGQGDRGRGLVDLHRPALARRRGCRGSALECVRSVV